MNIFIQAAELTTAAFAGFGFKSFWAWRKEKKKKPDAPKMPPKRIDTIYDGSMEPISVKSKDVYEWDSDLRCPICDAGNMWYKAEPGKDRTRASKHHNGCRACVDFSEPHMHVECWDCNYKFLMVREST